MLRDARVIVFKIVIVITTTQSCGNGMEVTVPSAQSILLLGCGTMIGVRRVILASRSDSVALSLRQLYRSAPEVDTNALLRIDSQQMTSFQASGNEGALRDKGVGHLSIFDINWELPCGTSILRLS